MFQILSLFLVLTFAQASGTKPEPTPKVLKALSKALPFEIDGKALGADLLEALYQEMEAFTDAAFTKLTSHTSNQVFPMQVQDDFQIVVRAIPHPASLAFLHEQTQDENELRFVGWKKREARIQTNKGVVLERQGIRLETSYLGVREQKTMENGVLFTKAAVSRFGRFEKKKLKKLSVIKLDPRTKYKNLVRLGEGRAGKTLTVGIFEQTEEEIYLKLRGAIGTL